MRVSSGACKSNGLWIAAKAIIPHHLPLVSLDGNRIIGSEALAGESKSLGHDYRRRRRSRRTIDTLMSPTTTTGTLPLRIEFGIPV
jgi:hypothetical protein